VNLVNVAFQLPVGPLKQYDTQVLVANISMK